MGIETAIAGGSMLTGIMGAESAERQAELAERGQQAAISEQRRQFETTRQDLQPFRQAGLSALDQQRILLGLGPSDPRTAGGLSPQEMQAQAFAQLSESPGRRFLRERQERTLLRNAAAIGGLGGGNVRTALQEQAAGFAQQDIQNQFARLGQLAGQGQAATTNVGQFGQQTSANIGRALGNIGQFRAQGLAGQTRSTTGYTRCIYRFSSRRLI